MRIKTQFFMTLLLFGILLVAVSGSIIFSELQVAQAGEQVSIAGDVSQGANDLSYLASNYLIYRESQQLDRWQSKVASFSSDVAKLRAKTSEQEALVLNIQNNTRKYKDTFENVVSSLGNPSENQSGTIAQTSLQVSWSRMAVQSQDLVSNASLLSRMYKIQEDQWDLINVIVIAILIGIFIAYFLINYLIVQRRTLNSIARLQYGTTIVGTGNLDFKIAEQTKDEVGDLSRAFNRMTTNLKTVTASKTDLEIVNKDLEKEIYEREQAEEALRETRDYLDNLFNYANAPIIVWNPDFEITRFNHAFEHLTGRTANEVLGKKLDILFPDDSREESMDFIRKTPIGERWDVVEIPILHRNGTIRVVLWNSATVYAPDGKTAASTIAQGQDITERKKAEEALARAKDELEIRIKERTRDLAEANEQLKQYANRITNVQEEERKRIAYELHDDTAQYLSILKMQLGALAQSDKIQSPQLMEKLKYLERDADRAFNDVRRYSHELRPVVLEHMGLQAALEQIAEDYNKLGQLSVEFNVEGMEPDLSEEVKLGFFRIAQEALNNTRKHSKASKSSINLKFQEKFLEMSVSDNGTGFDVNEARSRSSGKGSLGLMSMQERANLIGAPLRIDTQLGEGTTVTLEISL